MSQKPTIQTYFDIRVPMRDGVTLSADITLPTHPHSPSLQSPSLQSPVPSLQSPP